MQLSRPQVRYGAVRGFQMFTLKATALVFYDYLITLDQEVRTVWKQKFSAVSLLILFTRWTLLWQAAVNLIPEGSVASHCYHDVVQLNLT